MTRKDREMIALLAEHICNGISYLRGGQIRPEMVADRFVAWYRDGEKLSKKTKAWIDNDGGE